RSAIMPITCSPRSLLRPRPSWCRLQMRSGQLSCAQRLSTFAATACWFLTISLSTDTRWFTSRTKVPPSRMQSCEKPASSREACSTAETGFFEARPAPQQTKKAAIRPPLSFRKYDLKGLHVLCLPALRAFDDVELNGLPFLQGPEPPGLNGRVMDKNI